MQPIESVPTEILLNVASNIEPDALTKFALASKALCEVAQETLYRDVVIHHNFGHALKLQTFLRTLLLARPEFCEKVRSLKLTTSTDDRCCSANLAGKPDVITPYNRENLDTLSHNLIEAWKGKGRRRQPGWKKWLEQGVHSAYAGFLLSILPCLSTLNLILDLYDPGLEHPDLHLCNIQSPRTLAIGSFQQIRTLKIPFHFFPALRREMRHLKNLSFHWMNQPDLETCQDTN
jgi:hypothetical protein